MAGPSARNSEVDVMEIFLFRHAVAEAEAQSGRDQDRALTGRGARRMERAVSGLERHGVGFQLLLHSPWLRAVQTAELLTPLLDGLTQVSLELAQPPTQALLDQFQGEAVAVVGHQPWLGELAGMLLGGEGHRIEWRKGGLVWLRGEPKPGGACVVAVLPPRVLRGM